MKVAHITLIKLQQHTYPISLALLPKDMEANCLKNQQVILLRTVTVACAGSTNLPNFGVAVRDSTTNSRTITTSALQL
jgi:hypothetical protein